MPDVICARCAKIEQATEAEMQAKEAEAIEQWGNVELKALCDECFKEFMAWYNSERRH